MITTKMTANTMNNNRTSPPLHVRTLTIATRIRLHPGFVEDPGTFARQHGVDLVRDVFPATSFKKDPDTRKKREKVKANIHLVRDGAIRLFTERDGDGDWIRSIDLNPAVLLHDDKNHLLIEPDLVLALDILKTKVAPLLADQEDVRHIVPGLAGDNEHIAYWRTIGSEVRLPGILLFCLHRLSHPTTGPAEGANEEEIKLGHFGDDCVIRFKKDCWIVAGPDGAHEVQGVRVKLSLKGDALLAEFGRPGTMALVKEIERVVAFRASDVTRVHQEVMSRLEGTYLPVPPEWDDMGTPAAKIIALLSQVTSIPLDELRAKHEAQSKPSPSTRKRLTKDVKAALDSLKSVPVSSLFRPDVYGSYMTGCAAPLDDRIGPLIAAAYGPDTSSH
jgi:hypothetical protein